MNTILNSATAMLPRLLRILLSMLEREVTLIDHQTKSVVKVDGKDVLTTEVHKQSQPMKCSVEVAPGEHDIRIDTWSMWEGNWELHTVENGYSIDCNYAFHDTYKKKKTYKYHVVYDLDKGTYLGE